MVQAAFVYKTGPAGPEYLGKKEFDLPLRAEETNSYIHQRERQVVHVDRIEPTSWKPNSGLVPTAYVSGATAKQKPERDVVPRRRKKSAPTER
jgi:hypothetical protein